MCTSVLLSWYNLDNRCHWPAYGNIPVLKKLLLQSCFRFLSLFCCLCCFFSFSLFLLFLVRFSNTLCFLHSLFAAALPLFDAFSTSSTTLLFLPLLGILLALLFFCALLPFPIIAYTTYYGFRSLSFFVWFALPVVFGAHQCRPDHLTHHAHRVTFFFPLLLLVIVQQQLAIFCWLFLIPTTMQQQQAEGSRS